MAEANGVCAQERELREQWERSHLLLHVAEREAVQLARESVDQRLEGMNELRIQITTERGTFLPREVFDREHGRLSEEVRVMRNDLTRLIGERSGMGVGWQIAIGVVGLVGTIAVVVNAVRMLSAH